MLATFWPLATPLTIEWWVVQVPSIALNVAAMQSAGERPWNGVLSVVWAALLLAFKFLVEVVIRGLVASHLGWLQGAVKGYRGVQALVARASSVASL